MLLKGASDTNDRIPNFLWFDLMSLIVCLEDPKKEECLVKHIILCPKDPGSNFFSCWCDTIEGKQKTRNISQSFEDGLKFWTKLFLAEISREVWLAHHVDMQEIFFSSEERAFYHLNQQIMSSRSEDIRTIILGQSSQNYHSGIHWPVI